MIFQSIVTLCLMKNRRLLITISSFLIVCLLLLLSFSESFAAGGINSALIGPYLAGGADMPSGMPGLPGTPSMPSISTQSDLQRKREIKLQEEKRQGGETATGERPASYVTEEKSDFERYLSDSLDVTDVQLSILRLQPDIRFSMTPITPIPPGHTILSIPGNLGGGFIIGSQEALANGFRAAGIKSPLYIATDIKQFGYNLFEESFPTFVPVDSVPAGPDYILGPGDEINVSIWGKVNAEYRSLIDNDGKVNIPTVGVLQLTGLSFREARLLIEKEFSRYFTDIKLNISMGNLRSITVFVVGNVRRPGSYTLSSFSTIINALFAAGGPSKVGSLRNIKLNRKGQASFSLDLYDFILHGDKSKDIRLLPEDVIFIPPVGHLAGIAGNVKVPAIYELKGETKVRDLIEMAGGLNSISFKNRTQILRIENGEDQNLIELNLSEEGKEEENNLILRDGDVVRIFPVSQTVEKVVHIRGAVKSQGTYGYKDGMAVKDLLTYSGGILRYANKEDAELTRVSITPDGPVTQRIIIKLQKAIEGDTQYNIPLKEDDYLFVKTVPEWGLYKTVTVSGEVKFPGTYTINKGEALSSLIERAGGYTDRAYLKGAVFMRESVRTLQQKQLDESINRLEQEMISQSARTIESALSAEEAQQQKEVAEQRRGLIAKMRSVKAKGAVSIRLSKPEKFKNSSYDIPLEDGDILNIPEKPHQVQVIGSVYNPTAFVHNPSWTVESYLRYAGGMTRNAEYDDIYVLKMDGTAISKREWSGRSDISGDSDEGWFFKTKFMSSTLDPGDTIVVPEKIERVVWLREVKDLTQILYQIAVTAGVLIVAF